MNQVKLAARQRMRELAFTYADALPALDSHHLLQGLEGVSLVTADLGECDGMYDPEHHLILINNKSSFERQRFTLAHEISHALLIKDEDLLCDLHDYFYDEALEKEIEILCNIGAAALLIRPQWITECTTRFGYTAKALIELTRRAHVSYSVAAYTLAEQTPVPTIYALCQSYVSQLQVSFSTTSASMLYSWSKGTIIPTEHPIFDVWSTHLPMESFSYIPFRSGKRMPAYLTAHPTPQGMISVSFNLQ